MHRPLVAAGLAAAATAASAADIVTFDANVAGFGAGDPDGNGASPQVVFETTFALPAIASIDLFTVELAHSFLSDLDLRLVGPEGEEFVFALGQSSASFPEFDGGFDASDLGDGGSALDGVSAYSFAEIGDVWNDGSDAGDPAPGGIFGSVTWATGPFTAGDWTLRVIDAWDTGDDGALGSLSVAYTIPGPGALALLGAWAAGRGSRRRR